MNQVAKRLEQTLILLAITAPLAAQQPLQFKANVTKKDSADRSTSTGTVYFGGAKMRSELTVDGQPVVALIDPTGKTQYLLMTNDKTYMQMPIGQGPGSSMTTTGPSDPTNPCAGGSGNTNCVQGGRETVNGYETIRWSYTNSAGVGTRAWISTRLRFAIKSQDDDGSSMELSNIAEGPQPVSLFAIPAGYQKIDMGAMGGMGAANGRGKGRGNANAAPNANDPMAAAMANVPPEMRAMAAAAMRGEMPQAAGAQGATGARGGAGGRGATGSAWERGNGFVVAITITAVQTDGPTTTKDVGWSNTERSSYSIKWNLSLPLNVVTPANGLPNAPGPMWNLVAGQPGMGSAAANRVPIALTVTTEYKMDQVWTSDCKAHGENDPAEPGTVQERMSTTTEKSVPVTDFNAVIMSQGFLSLSGDLKTYDLQAGIKKVEGQETTKSHSELTGCKDRQVHKEDKTVGTRTADYAFHLELKGEPLPATGTTINGSKRMPVEIAGRKLDATVAWTITPIR